MRPLAHPPAVQASILWWVEVGGRRVRVTLRGRVTGWVGCIEEMEVGGRPWDGDLDPADETAAEQCLVIEARRSSPMLAA